MSLDRAAIRTNWEWPDSRPVVTPTDAAMRAAWQTISALLDALDAAECERDESLPLVCSYCSFEIPAPAEARLLQEHVKIDCQYHPMRDVERRLEQAEVRAETAERERDELLAERVIYRACANGKALDALATLMEMTGSFNEQNPWLGVTAAVALLKIDAEKNHDALRASSPTRA